MWGGSYAGYDQWATAKEMPPHLATIVPAAAAHPGVDFPMRQQHLLPLRHAVADLHQRPRRAGPDLRRHAVLDRTLPRCSSRAAPLSELDDMLGNASPIFQEWLAHPTPDAYWDAMAPTARAVRAGCSCRSSPSPATTTAISPARCAYYRQHMRHGSPEGGARPPLSDHRPLGPCRHAHAEGGVRRPHVRRRQRRRSPKLHREWYDWTMKDGPSAGVPAEARRLLRHGRRGVEVTPTRSRRSRRERARTLLDSRRQCQRCLPLGHAWAAEQPAAGGAPDRYVYDPLEQHRAGGDGDRSEDQFVDHRLVLRAEPRGNGLVYHSAPFAEATEICGQPSSGCRMALDVPTPTSPFALRDRPDGRSVALADDVLRARYRGVAARGEARDARRDRALHFTASSGSSSPDREEGSRLRLVVRSLNTIHAAEELQRRRRRVRGIRSGRTFRDRASVP